MEMALSLLFKSRLNCFHLKPRTEIVADDRSYQREKYRAGYSADKISHDSGNYYTDYGVPVFDGFDLSIGFNLDFLNHIPEMVDPVYSPVHRPPPARDVLQVRSRAYDLTRFFSRIPSFQDRRMI